MTTESASLSADARTLKSAILRGVAEHSQSACAEAIGITESQISRFLSSTQGLNVDQVCGLLSSMNLGITGCAGGLVTISKTDWDALRGSVALFAQRAG